MSQAAAIIDYPLFVPPGELATIDHRSWTKRQADAYFEWLIAVKEDRISALLEFFRCAPPNAAKGDLLGIGAKAADVLKQPRFSQGEDLTNAGYALAADMGLMVAEALTAANPAIRWTIMRKPKSDLSYNLPVLTGFGPLTLDPVGGSIAEAHAIVRREGSGAIWQEIYAFWLDEAGASPALEQPQ